MMQVVTPSPTTGADIAREALRTPAQQAVGRILERWKGLPQVDCPLVHRFTPGLYSREVQVPAGTWIITKVHKTEHQFVLASGTCLVWTEADGVQRVNAGDVGVTKPGTRRVVYTPTGCRWVTFHPTNETDVDVIERAVIYSPENDDKALEAAAEVGQIKES